MAGPRDELPPGVEQGLDILAEVVLEHFTASPTTVTPFQTTQLSWRVKGPAKPFFVQIDGQPVAKAGTAEFTLFGTRVFTLEAVALSARQRLGSVRVELDESGCRPQAIPAAFIRAGVIDQARALIPAAGQVKRKNDPEVVLSPGQLKISLDLAVEIPNFFDADASVDIEFLVGLDNQRRIRATFRDVDVDVSFHLAEHILSLGSATIVQATAQNVMEAMLGVFGGRLAQDVTGGLRAAVAEFCDEADEETVLIRALLNENGLSFTCCRPQEDSSFTGLIAETTTLAVT